MIQDAYDYAAIKQIMIETFSEVLSVVEYCVFWPTGVVVYQGVVAAESQPLG